MAYRNTQWMVTDYGLEAIAGSAAREGLTPDYSIEASRLTETVERPEKVYDWPVHMSEKTWVNIGEFIDAFKAALDHHAGKYEPPRDPELLAKSIQQAFAEARRR